MIYHKFCKHTDVHLSNKESKLVTKFFWLNGFTNQYVFSYAFVGHTIEQNVSHSTDIGVAVKISDSFILRRL